MYAVDIRRDSQLGAVLSPGAIGQGLEIISAPATRGGRATTQGTEAGDAGKHSRMHKTAPLCPHSEDIKSKISALLHSQASERTTASVYQGNNEGEACGQRTQRAQYQLNKVQKHEHQVVYYKGEI